jgi:endonuclease YncB( thermonuclease family)
MRLDKPGEFSDAEREARAHRQGSWADPRLVPPWEFRRAERRLALPQ